MTPTTLEGQTLGKYRILEALGRGGMAQVYRAYHPQLDRYVAVKVLRSDLVEHDEFLSRFRREAHAVSGLRHTNIVQVFDFDVHDENYYMVMELLEGDTLRARLSDYRVGGERMPLPEILRTINDVLAGLDYAHTEGIIHRDIKPANIMLTKKGQAVLTDFGIAQIVGSTQYTVSGALMGTLNYMAPEQGLKGQCDRRSDIYSLGIVLYEMLTGYTPFDADTPLAILMKHLNDPLPLPSKIDPSLPTGLEHIVLKSLAKDPDYRYQSAAEMAADIKLAMEESLPANPRPVVPAPGGLNPRAVFSGEARGKITDHNFADADTDADIRATAQVSPITNIRLPESGSPLNEVLTSVTLAMGKLPIFALSTSSAVFGSMGIFLVFNFAIGILSTLSGENLMRRAWPVEIFLVASLLALLSWSAQNHWIQIPAGIIFGNALILAYCSLTGRWSDWSFLWMAELMVIWLSVNLPVRVGKLPAPASNLWGRVGGVLLSVASLFLSGVIILLAFLISLS